MNLQHNMTPTITDKAIRFDCEIRSIKSCVDHSFTLTLNIPEYNVEQAQELMTMLGNMVAVAIISVVKDDFS